MGGLLALEASALAPITGLVSPATGVPVTYNPDYTCAVPFLDLNPATSAPSSQLIASTGVTVTATANTAVLGDTAATYLYQNPVKVSTTLTFSPPVPAIKVVTRNHADATTTGGPGAFETLTFTSSSGLNQSVTNTDGPFAYVSPTQFSGMLNSLQIAYTYDNSPPPLTDARGSYLDMYISCVGLAPTTQTVNGATGTPVTATSAFT
ncbi:MAG: hypothetical protein KGP12_11035 [Actinomycetales bacterium]|nr:hypothetical protein [Actinomycetales bacterium]